jgi:TetR/AcrR family transcriptional regulator, transcriptional repressor for nem operon
MIIFYYEAMRRQSPSSSSRLRPPGRPREFDMDDALDKAILVFRENGYHATSIELLAAGTGLTSGSIYKAFKDKRGVFIAALDRYILLRNQQIRAVTNSTKSGLSRLRDVLAFYVASSQGAEGQRGCLVVGTATQLATFDSEIAARVSAVLKSNQAFLKTLIMQGQEDGSICVDLDASETAGLMVCMTQGMRVVGKIGSGIVKSPGLVNLAMKLVA